MAPSTTPFSPAEPGRPGRPVASKLKDLDRLGDVDNPAPESATKANGYQAVIDSLKSTFQEGGEREGAEQSDPPSTVSPNFLTPEQETVIIQSVEGAIGQMGKTGKDIFLGILHKRYGIVSQDIVDSPAKFMGTLRVYLGSTASVLERCALDDIEARLKVSASSLEEAVAILRGQASEATLSEKEAHPERQRTKKGDLILFEYHFPSHGHPDV